MRQTITSLFILSLILGGCSNLFTMYSERPLSLTEPVVCGNGRYDYEVVFYSGAGEFGDGNSRDIEIYCMTDDNRVDVTSIARWTLLGYWTVGYFMLLGLWMAYVAQRRRNEPQASPPHVNISLENEADIRALAKTHRIKAIKQVRQLKGIGLAEAKDYVDGLLADE